MVNAISHLLVRYAGRALACVAAAFAAACGPSIGAGPAATDGAAPAPGELTRVSVTPVPPEKSAPAIWFTGESKSSAIGNGSFEEWNAGQPYPAGWRELAGGPSAMLDNSVVKFGNASIRLSSEMETRMQPAGAPGAEALRGRHVYFGGWMYTETPGTVCIQVIEDWKQYHVAQPKQTNAWELVIVEADIAPETKDVLFAITIGQAAAAGSCYVDGAALVIE